MNLIQKKIFKFKNLHLECNKILKNVEIAYECYGELNQEKNNAILVCHALTGDSHASGKYNKDDKKSGWWNDIVGPNKAIDTNKYFVVCSNVLGSCYGSTGPSSINEETNKPYNLTFPMITVLDMVNAQNELRKHLKIDKWRSIIGGSLGGMQALQWAYSYPEMMESCILIASTAKLSPQAIAFNWVGRESIMHDINFNNGNYQKDLPPKDGLAIARMLGHITYLSESSMAKKFGRRLQEMENYNFEFSHNFAIESYLQYQGTQFVNRFDANSYLYVTRAMDYFNLEENGSLANALTKTKTKFFIISFSSDWLFPPNQSLEIVHALQSIQKSVSYSNIYSDYGHDAFLLEYEKLGLLLQNHLNNL